ncbi:MAG: PaRep2b protein [Pyrobaculum arsenaticum]|uniref:PaRep2b protein n=1 Tax=Pyrobaculum arsenaticum TaxID=121277 RepID=UPI002274EC01|nr:PaRep2b protein [Pyrobaculum arsenaticum]
MLPAKLVLNLARGVEGADTPPIRRVEAEHGVALRVVAMIERALIPAAVSAVGVVGAIAAHDAVLSAATPIAAAIALANADQFKEAVKKAREAAERIYEAAKELWEAAKVALERIIEIVVEAIARALDYVKAYWFVLAAAAAGLIAYSLAQQLDFSLWQEHVAFHASLIAGIPQFKKAELPLKEKAPAVWEAAERFWRHGGREALAELVDRLNNSGWLKEQAVKAVEAVKASEKRMISRVAKKGGSLESVRRVAFTWRDVAVAYALAEAAYRHLAPHMPDIEAVVKEVAEKLARGEAVDVYEHYRQFRHFAERIREVVWILRARLAEIQTYARELGLAEEEFELRLAEELAWATVNELNKLGGATLADKIVAFTLGLETDSAYGRVVLWLAERGEGVRVMAITPRTAYVNYRTKNTEGGVSVGEEPLRAVFLKLLAGLTTLNLEGVVLVPKVNASSVDELLNLEKGALEIIAKVRTSEDVKEVRGAAEWEKKREGSITVFVKGGLLDFLKREEFVQGIEKDVGAAHCCALGWLTTDASVRQRTVIAETTSLFQAALYKASGFEEVKAEDWGTATGAGFKVYYHGSSSGLYQRYLKIANGVRAGLGVVQPLGGESKEVEGNLEKLAKAKEAVKTLVDKLLAEGRISVHPAAGMSAEEAAERAKKAAEDIMSREAAEKIDPVENAPYGRVYYPLMHLLINDVSEAELAQFFTAAIFGDGTINPYDIRLILGEFDSDKLPYDRFHKLALWIAVIEKYRPVFEKYGVDITPRVYVWGDAVNMRFNPKAAGLLFALGGGPIWRIYDKYVREVGQSLWDAGFIKAEDMLYLVKEAFKDVKVRWHIDEAGERPVLRIRFVKNVGGEEVEVANLNVYVKEPDKELFAEFVGSRERAEALASILRAWGGKAEAKPVDKNWRVVLSSGQLAAVDHPEFKRALEAFIIKVKEEGLLTDKQAERKLMKLSTGPNTVEIAGVGFNITPEWEGDDKRRVPYRAVIRHYSVSLEEFREAVKVLEEFGLVRGVDFTAEWDEAGVGDIWLKAGAFDKAVETLKGAGFKEGEDFAVYKAKGGGGRVRVKKPKENLKRALEALEKAGLEKGKDYTPPAERAKSASQCRRVCGPLRGRRRRETQEPRRCWISC